MLIDLKQVGYSLGERVLFDDVTLTLFPKQKVGLIGQNGCGKSTFFSMLLGQIQSSSGELTVNRQLSMSHLSQHMPSGEETAIDYVLAGDAVYHRLITALKEAELCDDYEKIVEITNDLSETFSFQKPAKAAEIMVGLGFQPTDCDSSLDTFSGGWRMRLNLARCLMSQADVLLLDEPTNHLDLEAIMWLEKWLKQYPGSLIVVSHDRDFLDGFCTHILHIASKTMTLYTGNYSQFEDTRATKLALQQAQFDKQQTKINHMMSFVTKFKAKASKAKQAQSRLKAIERMDKVMAVQIDSPFSFEFAAVDVKSNTLIKLSDVSAGYHNDCPIIEYINYQLQKSDRIGLLGLNGQGKSTFIKTLVGDLPPLLGVIDKDKDMRVGYFAQHQLEQLDLSLTPVEYLAQFSPKTPETKLRQFLGGFNFQKEMAMTVMRNFSGGEKARLVLAGIVFQKPNVLLLDEPTNHLDLDMREALSISLQSYEGALIVISHDRHFLRMVVDEYYWVHGKKLLPFDDDIDGYYPFILNVMQQERVPSVKRKDTQPILDEKTKRQLKSRQKNIETQLETIEHRLSVLDGVLSDPNSYASSFMSQLTQLLTEKSALIEQKESLEADWLLNEEKLK